MSEHECEREEIRSLTSEELEAVVGGQFVSAWFAIGETGFLIVADKDGYEVNKIT
jgi:hypothetical protein